jgi:hypothetical protein
VIAHRVGTANRAGEGERPAKGMNLNPIKIQNLSRRLSLLFQTKNRI